MAIPPDSSPYGSQTVTGPGWPNADEEALGAAAAKFEALALKITGSIVPQQQGQLMKLSDSWEGAGSLAATGEATTIIGGHEANAAHAAAIAGKFVRPVTWVNAVVVQWEAGKLPDRSGLPGEPGPSGVLAPSSASAAARTVAAPFSSPRSYI